MGDCGDGVCGGRGRRGRPGLSLDLMVPGGRKDSGSVGLSVSSADARAAACTQAVRTAAFTPRTKPEMAKGEAREGGVLAAPMCHHGCGDRSWRRVRREMERMSQSNITRKAAVRSSPLGVCVLAVVCVVMGGSGEETWAVSWS